MALGSALACGALLAAASPALAGKAKTRRVSVSSSGKQADASRCPPLGQINCAVRSSSRSISAGGRVVAFDSEASNLVPGDTNGAADIFRRRPAALALARASRTTPVRQRQR